MTDLTAESVASALERVIPEPGVPAIGASHRIASVDVGSDMLRLHLLAGYPCLSQRETMQAAIQSHFAEEFGEAMGSRGVELRLELDVGSHAVQSNLRPLPGVKNIIAVASGKGGVGKSTVAANIALALQADGARVGMLDADIYGPSQPRMLGASGQPEIVDNRKMRPIEAHGLQVMSIGFLIDPETPTIWRGPMVTQALAQMLGDTLWEALDYLVMDLPPGTGDTQLSLAQKIPVSGALIVTTPQEISVLDARKGLKMFEKVNISVLGVVENMSYFRCGKCGEPEAVFGEGGGERLAGEHDVPLLGRLPLASGIREDADRGQPSVVADPAGEAAGIYRQIARRASAQLVTLSANAAAFPDISFEDN